MERNPIVLVLTRKIGEQIVINGDICVSVISVNGGRVRLGVVAPRAVPVFRGELVTPAATASPLVTV
jgi:carbon storage regulator